MDYDLGTEADELRDELRTLIAEHLPADYLSPFSSDPEDQRRSEEFVALLAERGLLTLAWPMRYGGREAGPWQQAVLREEMWAHYEPRANHYLGLNWAGPAVMRFGTDEQRDFHLPRIASGENTWCQGFSEPGAGTDLASLRTFARWEDGHWSIHGQKVWTSYAAMANWCMCAVRTDRDVPGRDGITLFMLPMDQEGVEVRPIPSMLGNHHLNELFLDGAVVQPEHVLGELNHGWSVIRYALTLERVGIARYARADRLLMRVFEALGPDYETLPESLRGRMLRAVTNNRIARLMAYQVTDAQSKDRVDDADAGAARIATTLTEQEVADVLFEATGPAALDGKTAGGAPVGGAVEDFWRYTNASTVASGSLDVQRMHVARGALGGARRGS